MWPYKKRKAQKERDKKQAKAYETTPREDRDTSPGDSTASNGDASKEGSPAASSVRKIRNARRSGGPETIKDRIKRLVRKRLIPYTILAAIAFAGLCTRSYIQNRNVAMVNIALNYEDAGKGLAPNGTRFNMYDMISDDILQSAIDMAALQNVEPADLSKCISLSSRGSGDESYISSEYIMRLNIDPDGDTLIQASAQSLLPMICKAFSQDFYRLHVSRADALLFSFEDTEYYEYQELADYFNMKLEILNSYVSGRISDNNTFRSDTTGNTFREIQEKINNVISVDIRNLNAYIRQTGVAADKPRYLAKLAYLNYMENDNYRKRFAEYSVRVENIELYNILQTSIVMVPTYDTSGEFYMSMTKIGIDAIAADAQNWNEQAAASLDKISRTDEIIQSVTASTASEAQILRTEEMIAQVEARINELTRLILLTDQDYIAYSMDDYITFTYGDIGYTQKIDLVSNMMLCAAFYAFLWLMGWRAHKRKETMTL
ncbi:MAG: hypothetical protein Q4D04_09920 [Clostridia bacterium]|nr:hypothetical protein [Clostridia bacterium]